MPILTTATETFTISADEAEALAGYLKLNRDDAGFASNFVSTLNFWLKKQDTETLKPQMVADALIDAVDQESQPHIGGLLYVGRSGTLYELPESISQEEVHTAEPFELKRYLMLRRSGYWLAEFISLEVSWHADGKRRTPAQVMKNLEDYIDQFVMSEKTTRNMLRDHPELFPTTTANLKAEQPPENHSSGDTQFAKELVTGFNRALLQENDIGRVARESERAKGAGDHDRARRFARPVFEILGRVFQSIIDNEPGETTGKGSKLYPVTASEQKTLSALLKELDSPAKRSKGAAKKQSA